MTDRPVAIVTGGSRGIGAAITKRLASAAFVHLVYREDSAAAGRVAQAVEDQGGATRLHKLDVADEAALGAFMADIGERVDILVNNAAIIDDRLVMATRTDAWERVLRVNLTAPFMWCRAVLPLMLDRGWGRIINISSSSAVAPAGGQAAYAAAKAGLEGLTRALAAEVGHKGVRVNAVAPGIIETEMSAPLRARLGDGPWGQPDDVAALVAFLASEEAGHIQGQVLAVDGGRSTRRQT